MLSVGFVKSDSDVVCHYIDSDGHRSDRSGGRSSGGITHVKSSGATPETQIVLLLVLVNR